MKAAAAPAVGGAARAGVAVAPPAAAAAAARALGQLRVAALAPLPLYVALVVLFTNVPAGWDGQVGYGWGGLAAFRALLPYPSLALSPLSFTIAGFAILAGLWASLAAAARAAAQLEGGADDARAVRWVLAASALQHALLVVWLPPVLSRDLYHFAAFGRMVLGGVNPYTHAIDGQPADPVTALADWRSLSSHYGAFFTWVSAGAAWIGGDSPVRTAWAFKAISAVADLAAALGAYRLARVLTGRSGLVALVLCALGPLFVIEGAGNGHNEPIMMALALAGLAWWYEGKRARAMVALTLSTLVKFVTGVLPLLLIAQALAQPAPPRRRLALAVKLAGIGAALLVALYAPFGATPAQWGLAATGDLVVNGRAVVGGAAPQLLGLRVAVFALGVAAAVAVAARAAVRAAAPRAIELGAALSLLFVLTVFEWRFCWYVIPAAALAAAAAPSPTRSYLRFVVYALAVGWSLGYPMLIPKM
jgi:hypothetical protein